jgi:hypothetical protein
MKRRQIRLAGGSTAVGAAFGLVDESQAADLLGQLGVGAISAEQIFANDFETSSLSLVGVVAHGSTLTINDALARFGARTKVKPLFVNLGNEKAGSPLGRITANYYSADSVLDTAIKNGQRFSKM